MLHHVRREVKSIWNNNNLQFCFIQVSLNLLFMLFSFSTMYFSVFHIVQISLSYLFLLQCLTNLWIGMQKGLISDVFFPEVCKSKFETSKSCGFLNFQFNMLDRISKEQQLQICKWLDGLVKKYHSTNSMSAIFPLL